MKSKQLTVIVPLRNWKGDVPPCMKSLLTQEVEMEILCVADHIPKDGMERLAAMDERIRVIPMEDAGFGSLCNRGLEEAGGKFVAFVGARDILEKGMYSELCRLAVRQKLDLIQGNTADKNQQDKSFCGYVLRPAEEKDWWKLSRPVACGVYKKDFLRKNSIRFHEESQDAGIPSIAFRLQALLYAERAYFMGEAFLREGSFTETEMIARAEDLFHEYEFLGRLWNGQDSLKQISGSILSRAALGNMLAELQKLPSLQKAAYIKQMAEYFRNLHKEGAIDYYALDPEEHREISRLMWDTEACTEDTLLGRTPRMAMEFLFPYHLFSKGRRVVIYGAGNVGRLFYRQAKHDRYVSIVGIVDRGAVKDALPGIPVKPVEELKKMDYDDVLIAIRDKAPAEAAKEFLMSLGVSSRVIQWDGEAYFRDDFYQRLYFPIMEGWNGSYEAHEKFLQSYRQKIEASDYDHVVPYHLFPRGAKVAIYGGSEVGRKFYRQAVKDGYLEIVGIVDRNIQNTPPSDIPLKPLEALPYMKYDYVLIAIRNDKGARAAKEALLQAGVPAPAIRWDGQVYLRDDFYQKQYLEMMGAWNAERKPHGIFVQEYAKKMEGSIYDHAFPYHLFEPGARVVLYGAGDVGQKFYLQGMRARYVEIVGIVASDAASLRLPEIPVEPVEALSSMEYDYVLICIRNSKGAESVRKKLLEQGVPEKSIKWDGGMYLQQDFYRKIYLKLMENWSNYGTSYQKMVKGMTEKMKILPREYVFPYHLFREGEKVVLYGGVNTAGKALWYLSKEFDYVKVIAVVDPEADKVRRKDMPVAPPEALRQYDFDSVLVTMREKKEADTARDELIRMGVAKEKVKWAGRIYAKTDFYKKYWFEYLRFIHEITRSKI